MSNFVLYNYFRSSTSYRVRIALHHKGINFEYKPVHLLNNGGEQNSAEYRSLNPMGGVPTLVHNGHAPLAQSMAIVEYLDMVSSNNPLFPMDAIEKSLVRQFCENINCELHPFSNLRVLQHLEKKCNFTENMKTEWIHHWMKLGFDALEKILQKKSKDYSFGEKVTAADIFLIPHVFTAQRFQFDLQPYTAVLKVNENCLKLEAFKKAHPYRQVDTPAELKIT